MFVNNSVTNPAQFQTESRLQPCGSGALGEAVCGSATALLTMSLSSLLGLKYGIFLAGTSTRSPVLGLRPTRGLRWRVRKLPKPRISILSPARSERTMLSKMVSTMTSLSFRVSSASPETSSIKSALVISHAPLRKRITLPHPHNRILSNNGNLGKSKFSLDFRASGQTQRLFPQIIEPNVGFHQLGAAGQVLGDIAEQQVEQAFALLLRMYQCRFAFNPYRFCRVFNRRTEVADLVHQLQRNCLLSGPHFAVRQRAHIVVFQVASVGDATDELPVHVV